MIRTTMISAMVAGAVLTLSALPAAASPPLVGKAKSAGMPAQNCQYCHASAMPKKETYKADDLNERGKWLIAEKDKRKAKDVDAGWLKEYPGGK
jgi:hypothetical protein